VGPPADSGKKGLPPARRRLIIAASLLLVILAFAALLFRQIPEDVSAPLFVLVVILEVIIAPIPGGAIGYLGAARYGFWQAWPLLYIGNIIGTTIVFLLARRLGTPLFHENVSAKTRRRYDALLDQHPFLLWLVYAVPVIPVDVLSAMAGLSTLPTRRFLLIAYTGYIFYTAIVAAVGAFFADFVGVTEAVTVIGVVFMIGLVWWLWKSQIRRT
jgi:uncharacterized membrane protein YdjX (TVP38/TMEM64 family)